MWPSRIQAVGTLLVRAGEKTGLDIGETSKSRGIPRTGITEGRKEKKSGKGGIIREVRESERATKTRDAAKEEKGRIVEVPSRETKPKQQERHIRDKKTKEGVTSTYLGLPSFLPIWISRSPFCPFWTPAPLFFSDNQPKNCPTGRTERRSNASQGVCE